LFNKCPQYIKQKEYIDTMIAVFGNGIGIHWEELNEDISVAGLLAGR
jgi:hypothetical protein